MNKDAIKIRPMRAADATDVLKLMAGLTTHFGDETTITEQDLLSHCLGKNKLSRIFLATLAGQPVGFAITRDWINLYLNAKIRHIDFIFVIAACRSQGIASAMIKFIKTDARAKGCKRLDINAAVDNEGANRLYNLLGFEPRTDQSIHYRLWLSG